MSAEESVFIVPHRAIYDLKLDNASDGTVVLGVSGRMVYELIGSECQGYTTRFRFVSRMYVENMPVRLIDHQMMHYETADSLQFQLNATEKVKQTVSRIIEGKAERINDGIIVKLKKPTNNIHKLEKADFPIMQLKGIIQHAKAGHHFYEAVMFDGTGHANRVMRESVIIGDKKDQIFDENEKFRQLNTKEYWPITISYFEDVNNKDSLPVNRMSFLLYENGVMRDVLLDYGNISIYAKLNTLEFLSFDENIENCKH
ncbi:EipB family protein [Bartonella sp. F02]|uniref:EipB family protein n=1 Tax=Bartonella sp. F02 TaxID=2967262 RepID=UPI003FA42CD1